MKKTANMIKDQKGFTLVELLIVIALLGLSVGITNDILVSLIRSYNKTQVKNEVEQQANFVSLKLEKELRNANSVSSASSNSLVFNSADGVQITYAINSSGVISRNGVALTTNTNPGGVFVSCYGGNACFSSNITSAPQVVNINLKFTQADTGADQSYSGEIDVRSTIVVMNTN